MSMTPTLFLSIALTVLLLALIALVDLVRATDMDPVARVIVAAALILAAPVGLLLWLFVRGGRPGVFLGAALLALAFTAVIAFAVSTNRGVTMVQVSGASRSFSVSAGASGQPIP